MQLLGQPKNIKWHSKIQMVDKEVFLLWYMLGFGFAYLHFLIGDKGVAIHTQMSLKDTPLLWSNN